MAVVKFTGLSPTNLSNSVSVETQYFDPTAYNYFAADVADGIPENLPTVTLELTWPEAVAIKSLLGSVGGSKYGSYRQTIRRYTNILYSAMRDVPHISSAVHPCDINTQCQFDDNVAREANKYLEKLNKDKGA